MRALFAKHNAKRTGAYSHGRLFALIACLSLITGPAFAQDSDASNAGDADTGEPQAVQTTEKSENADGEKSEGTGESVNPRMSLGGEAKTGGKMPFSLTASLSNSLGIGTFLPGSQRVPDWGTGLSIRPGLRLPKADYLPNMRLGASMGFSVPWLLSYNSGGVLQRQLSYSDLGVNLMLPGLVKTDWGLGVSSSMGVSLPISLASRFSRRIGSGRIGASVGWSKYNFNVGWSPSISGVANTTMQPKIKCDEAPASLTNPGVAALNFANNPADGITDIPLQVYRDAERDENGDCILVGRNSLGGFSNTLSAGYTFLKQHSISASVSWRLGFMAPLADAPELRSEYASSQNFSESSSGDISYTYSVPIDTPLSFTGGMGSGQPAYTMDGKNFRFPFYDFVSPGNNFTSFYFVVTAGI